MARSVQSFRVASITFVEYRHCQTLLDLRVVRGAGKMARIRLGIRFSRRNVANTGSKAGFYDP